MDRDRLMDDSVEHLGPAVEQEVFRLVDRHGLKPGEIEMVLSEVVAWAVSIFFDGESR